MNAYVRELNEDILREEVEAALRMRSRSAKEAIRMLDGLSSQGSIVAKIALGDIYAYGRHGIEKNLERSIELLTQAAELGSIEGKYRLARIFVSQSKFDRAIELFQQLSLAGFLPASFMLGTIFFEGKFVEQDRAMAELYFKRASDGGHLLARQWLGYLNRHSQSLSLKMKGICQIISTIIPLMIIQKNDPDSDLIRNW